MSRERFRKRVAGLLELADVHIGRGRPGDIEVHDETLYGQILARGSLGLGEAYMEGRWDCGALDHFFHKVLAAGLEERVRTPGLLLAALDARLRNRQSVARSRQVGEAHYNIGNDLYRRMLDERMIYSCAYWDGAMDLAAAQERKLDLICRKLHLGPGQRLLDIGCGWGGLARFAAERYGTAVVGVTISSEQAGFARDHCRGLPVEIRLQDYRMLDETFDRVVSVGMFEHVGYKNYATFMAVADRCLAADGLFLLQTIGGNTSTTHTDPWIDRYIFPNGMLPSAVQVCQAVEGYFMIEDWHNFGPDYDRTLMAWAENFEAAWPELAERYDRRFYRMWRYYLLSCAGAFRARVNQLWQIVLSKGRVPPGYRAPR